LEVRAYARSELQIRLFIRKIPGNHNTTRILRMKRWYVLESKPQKEILLYEQLRLRAMEVYYPRVRVKPANPRARKIKSYFPGYLFVHIDLDLVGISSLQWVPGAHALVNFGGEPAFVADSVLQSIRMMVEKNNADGSYFHGGLKPGDVVSINDGPFWDGSFF
jgi:transcription antitermination factor NusG